MLHAPEVVHVSIPLNTHCVALGTHTPPQSPPTWPIVPTHAFAQVVAAPHCPFALHVSTCVSLVHRVVLGVQAASHWGAVIEPSTQVPAVLHVSGVAPSHPVVSGVHSPVHAPAVHRYEHGVHPLPQACGSVWSFMHDEPQRTVPPVQLDARAAVPPSVAKVEHNGVPPVHDWPHELQFADVERLVGTPCPRIARVPAAVVGESVRARIGAMPTAAGRRLWINMRRESAVVTARTTVLRICQLIHAQAAVATGCLFVAA